MIIDQSLILKNKSNKTKYFFESFQVYCILAQADIYSGFIKERLNFSFEKNNFFLRVTN